jgi:hypothetical protein
MKERHEVSTHSASGAGQGADLQKKMEEERSGDLRVESFKLKRGNMRKEKKGIRCVPTCLKRDTVLKRKKKRRGFERGVQLLREERAQAQCGLPHRIRIRKRDFARVNEHDVAHAPALHRVS